MRVFKPSSSFDGWRLKDWMAIYSKIEIEAGCFRSFQPFNIPTFNSLAYWLLPELAAAASSTSPSIQITFSTGSVLATTATRLL
jgi:hypothetical protein